MSVGRLPGPPRFLTWDDIRTLCQDPDINLVAPFSLSSLKNWSYDLSLGAEAFLSSDKDLRRLSDRDAIFIQPGEFALLLTHEVVNLPLDTVAFISLKSAHAFKGLVNISGFHVDPGYSGKLALSVYNAGPNTVVLRQGDPLYMIIFARLEKPAPLRGKENPKYKRIDHLQADMIASVKGPPVSLVSLHDRITRLEQILYIVGGVLAATIGAIAAAVVLGFIRV